MTRKEHSQQQFYNEVVGVSDQLLAEFEMLRQIETEHGPKFHRKSVDKLATHLVCRHYGHLCYEFAHFNWAILHANGLSMATSKQLLQYYWINNGSSSTGGRAYFHELVAAQESKSIIVNKNASILVDEHFIDIQVFEHQFCIHYSRFNILSCLMEWLISVVPNLLEKIEKSLLGKSLNAIKELASDIQKEIYQYLADHLPTAKLQQRYRKLYEYYDHHELSDDSIVSCWQTFRGVEGFTKYNGVVLDTFSFIEANEITESQVQVGFAQELDNISEQTDEIDKDSPQSFFDAFEKARSQKQIDLNATERPIKALGKKQIAFLQLIADFPNYVNSFTKSYLRWQIFGKYQHQLIQATRTTTEKGKWPEIEEDYLVYKSQCIQMMASNQQCLLAIVHILLPNLPNESGQIIAKLAHELPGFKELNKQIIKFLSKYDSDILKVELLQAHQKDYPLMMQFIERTKTAYKQINRQGFTTNSLAKMEDYVLLAEILFDINHRLKHILKQILKNSWDTESIFESDRHIFINEFSKIHAQDIHE